MGATPGVRARVPERGRVRAGTQDPGPHVPLPPRPPSQIYFAELPARPRLSSVTPPSGVRTRGPACLPPGQPLKRISTPAPAPRASRSGGCTNPPAFCMPLERIDSSQSASCDLFEVFVTEASYPSPALQPPFAFAQGSKCRTPWLLHCLSSPCLCLGPPLVCTGEQVPDPCDSLRRQ